MYTVSTSNYHHGNLRQALLDAGLERLESEQSPDFSLRELTRSVGVSVNAAYRHFASKEDLLCAMAAEGFYRLTGSQAKAIQDNSDRVEGFREAGRAYVSFARQHPALFRLMFSRFAAGNPNPEIKAGAQLAYEGMRHSVAALMKRPTDDSEVIVTAMYAWSLVHGLSHLIIDGQFDPHTDDIDGMVDAVLQRAAIEEE